MDRQAERPLRTSRVRTRGASGLRWGVVVALAVHAAAYTIARHVELEIAWRAPREIGPDEPMFTLDLRGSTLIVAEAEESSAPVTPATEPVPGAPLEDAGAIDELLEIARAPEPLVAPATELAATPPLPEAVASSEPMGPPLPPEMLAAAELPHEFALPLIESVAPSADDALAHHLPSSEVGGHASANPTSSPAGPKSSYEPASDPSKLGAEAAGAPSRASGAGTRGASASEGSTSLAGDVDHDASALRLLSAPPPSYPAAARRAGRTGSVTCRLVVDRDGVVVSVEVVSSSGHADLDEAARKALAKWRFEPLGRLTEAPRVRVLQKLKFQLEKPAH